MSSGTPYLPNTAAVKRDGTDYIFITSQFTGDNNGIMQISVSDEQSTGKQVIVELDGQMVRTVENTPLAATVVWDNSQINLYYFAPSTNGAFLEEICQRGDDGWTEGALGKSLRDEGIFPHLNATVTVWNEREVIHVFFKSNKDREGEITCAKYTDGQWQARTISYGGVMSGVAA